MKQVVQRLRDGRIEVLEVPCPELTPHGVLVDVRASLLSAGTERSKVETGRESLIGKARSRPDQVQQVIEKARKDGIRDTIDAVRSRLDAWSGLGYSSAGVVLEAGSKVRDLAPGDRVACGGGDYAVHAEVDYVPGNLAVRVPDGVTFEEAAFATVGSIAMHGVRQADVRVGERVAVIGMGLIGQLAGQILRAAGCTVHGVDLRRDLIERGLSIGAVDGGFTPDSVPGTATDFDAVVITAATKSSDPVELAAELLRDRGRVVVVGDVGMELPRPPYYGKELELRLSRSYGPGRYDPEYEERALDYPAGYVRWTEQRNMGAVVDLVASGRLDVGSLIDERVPIEQATEAYERLLGKDGKTPLGIVLQYGETPQPPPRPRPAATEPSGDPSKAGVIGTGSFAQRILIPGLRRAGFALEAAASASGVSARSAADQFGFGRAATADEVIGDAGLGLVAIATRHSSHARLAADALGAGKAVFVEKPPCIDPADLPRLRDARDGSGRPLAVGFNRRHAPLARRLRDHVAGRGGPIELLFRVSAGVLPADHWLNDLEEGGGRLLGEGCHFVDFACWAVDALPERVSCTMRPDPGRPLAAAQRFSIGLEFADGSLATIAYLASGASDVGKEYVEAHAGGRSAVLDDFRSLDLYGAGKDRSRGRTQDKGHDEQFRRLHAQLNGGEAPEGPDPLGTMAVTFAALRSAESGTAVSPAELD